MKKSVLITGVNGGIGSVLVNKFRANGYKVIGIDRLPDNSGSDVFFQVDLMEIVNDQISREAFETALMQEINDLFLLINNAAVQKLDHTADMSIETWKETIDVNLTAPFILTQFCYDALKKNSGSVINISSIHSTQTKRKFLAYATSKAGLVGLTKAMAVDVQGDIRVNVICPAAISTQMLRDGFKENISGLEKLKHYHPIKKIGIPEQVANLALFLSKTENDFINGAVVSLDGGISSVLHDPEWQNIEP